MVKFHKDGTLPTKPSTIFVFGSNLAGVHGKGAAKAAFNYFGAKPGQGRGRIGRSYAIPTKKADVKTPRPLEHIQNDVNNFLDHARSNSDREFFVTRVGCGLAGYSDEDIAPMFRGAPDNCSFAEEWREYLL